MARVQTTFYQADPLPDSTLFEWATSDNDLFNREIDLSFLARALERHDHSDGRGKPSARATAGSIDTTALANLAVSTGKIADGAVTPPKISANAVTNPAILDGTIAGAKLALTAVTDRLGYTPINKAGDSGIGNLSLARRRQLLPVGYFDHQRAGRGLGDRGRSHQPPEVPAPEPRSQPPMVPPSRRPSRTLGRSWVRTRRPQRCRQRMGSPALACLGSIRGRRFRLRALPRQSHPERRRFLRPARRCAPT
jgi:hypothetical protein